MEGFKSKTTYSSPINTEVKVEEKKQLSNPQFLEPQSVDSLTKSLDNISEISKDKSVLDEDFLSENERFLTTGKNILGEVDEKEIELSPKTAEKYLEDQVDDSVRFTRYRSEVIDDAIETYKKSNPFVAGNTLLNFSSKVIKKGKFSENAIKDGKKLFQWLDDRWVGKNKEMSDTESSFYECLGRENTLDFLKVDGMSLKDFVKMKYSYNGDAVGQTPPEDIYCAYVAMILRRQNHSITLVRPTFDGKKAQVEIKSLNIAFHNTKTWGQTGKNIVAAARNKQYEEYHELSSKQENIWEAAAAVSRSAGKKALPMKDLWEQKKILTRAGKGTHKNYDDFVASYDSLLDSVAILCVNPDQAINQQVIRVLASESQTVIKKAQDYLKGKKMNLARHFAVQNILESVQDHVKYYKELENSRLFKSEKTTVTVNELINDNIQQKIDDMNFETVKFKDKMTKEEFYTNGGAVLHRYVTIEEADKYVKEGGGMICAIPVEGQPLLRELRPSLPKTVMAGDKEIPFCKTMQYMFKAIAVILVDKNGKMSPVEKKHDGMILEDRVDQLLSGDFASMRREVRLTAYQTLEKVFKPIIKNLLNENYMKEGKQVDSKQLSDEANEIIENYKTICVKLENPVNHSTDVNFMRFRFQSNFLKTLNYDQFMQREDIQEILSSDEFTEDDIKAVLNDFNKDLKATEEDLCKLRNLDMKTDEIPCIQTSYANVSFFRNIQSMFLNREMVPLEFEVKNTSRHDPKAFADYMDKNVDNIIIADNMNVNDANKLKENIKTLKAELDSSPTLSKKGKEILDDLTINYRKFNGHQSASLALVNDYYITAETTATEPDQFISAPLTMNGYMGQYRAEKDELEGFHDENGVGHKAKSFQKYHLHDNYFSYIGSKKSALKARIATILKTELEKAAALKSK